MFTSPGPLMYPFILPLFVVTACTFVGCGEKTGTLSPSPLSSADTFGVTLAKWYGDRTAAISLTYDHGLRWLSSDERLIQDILVEERVPMDFDFTNSDLDEWPVRRTYYLDTLIAKGFGVFGHGYDHIDSDGVSQDSARRNFRRCYDDMIASGLKPVAYAYPGGACYAESSRRALAGSGFLSGRRFSTWDHRDPWICPGNELAPVDWFNLPSLVMFDYELSHDPNTIRNTAMLIPFLDGAIEHRAWLITTYHEIKDGPGGTYRVGDFRNDIAAIKERDFWIASFCDATLYLRERADARATVSTEFGDDATVLSGQLLVSDGLPNDYYDHPLTVKLSVPQSLIGHNLEVLQEGRLVRSVSVTSAVVLLPLLPNELPYTLHLQ